MLTVVVGAINGAGVVLVLVVFVVSGCCGVQIVTSIRDRGLIKFGGVVSFRSIKILMTVAIRYQMMKKKPDDPNE